MSERHSYREDADDGVRVLFCIGVTDPFFDAESAEIGALVEAFKTAFDDLGGRFGVEVLGAMDDDELMVGPSYGWPWTAYILARAPDVNAVKAVTNVLRETEVNGHRLWRYAKIEARVGRQLFFGTE